MLPIFSPNLFDNVRYSRNTENCKFEGAQLTKNKGSEGLYSVKHSTVKPGKTSSVFIEAGIKAIAVDGIDKVSVSQVTELASATRPTFYSLFGNVDGLFAEIWLKYGDWFLENLASPTFRLEVTEPEARARMLALLEIFTVSSRISEIAEVVEPSAKKWWESLTREDNYRKLKLAWLSGQRLGSWLTYPIEPKALLAGFAVPIITNLGDKARSTGLPVKQLKLPPLKDPKIADGSVENQLLDSAIRVISRVGVEKASMTRISRNAQVTTGTIYPRFKNHDDLILASFARAITSVVEENFAQIEPEGFSPDDFGLVTIAGLLEDRKTWRNFRVEMHLAARLNRKLAENIRTALSITNERVGAGLGLLPISKTEREAVAFLVHSIGIGLAMLLNAGIAVNELDHRLITRDMIEDLGKR
jgi:AcrR family transcriptional regulator